MRMRMSGRAAPLQSYNPSILQSYNPTAHTRPPFQFNDNRVLLHLAAIELPEKDWQKNEGDQKHAKNEQNTCAWPVHYLEKDA